jgi:ClpP class serine protease
MKNTVNKRIQEHLNEELSKLESEFKSDVLVYNGPIVDDIGTIFMGIVEDLVSDKKEIERSERKLHLILTTYGGSAHAVERYVNILRHYYGEVNFIVPDYAFSAGTIFCMSGDNILMDFYSVLGPIDPQVRNKEGKYVPALGYLYSQGNRLRIRQTEVER